MPGSNGSKDGHSFRCPALSAAQEGTGEGMRGKLIIYFLCLIAFCGYVASPLVTAWSIREAIRTSDAAYLDGKVDWPRVKASLKASMADYALGPMPDAATTSMAGAIPKPGLWQRFKNKFGRPVVASMVDTMVTPHGLARLFSYGKSYNEKVRGLADEAKSLSLTERVKRSWERVTRAEFLTPTRFAMEMRDKADPLKSYSGLLELQGFQWRLVHLEVKGSHTVPGASTPQAKPAAISRAWSAMKQAALP